MSTETVRQINGYLDHEDNKRFEEIKEKLGVRSNAETIRAIIKKVHDQLFDH